jgi:hypothetical protein
VFAERSILIVQKSKFLRAKSKTGTIIYAFDNYQDIINATLTFSESLFQYNTAETSLFDVSDASIYIINSVIRDNVNTVFNLMTAYIKIVGLTIINNKCYNQLSGCLLRAITRTRAYVSGLTSEDITNSVEGGGAYIEESSIDLSFSSFTKLFSTTYGSCLVGRSSEILLVDIVFQIFNGNSIYCITSNVTITRGKFNNTEFKLDLMPQGFEIFHYSAIISDGCIKFLLQNGIFLRNIYALKGGAIFFTDSVNNILSESDIRISFSNFTDNKADNEGGALFIDDLNITLSFNIFENNMAIVGGAIYYFTAGKK